MSFAPKLVKYVNRRMLYVSMSRFPPVGVGCSSAPCLAPPVRLTGPSYAGLGRTRTVCARRGVSGTFPYGPLTVSEGSPRPDPPFLPGRSGGVLSRGAAVRAVAGRGLATTGVKGDPQLCTILWIRARVLIKHGVSGAAASVAALRVPTGTSASGRPGRLGLPTRLCECNLAHFTEIARGPKIGPAVRTRRQLGLDPPVESELPLPGGSQREGRRQCVTPSAISRSPSSGTAPACRASPHDPPTSVDLWRRLSRGRARRPVAERRARRGAPRRNGRANRLPRIHHARAAGWDDAAGGQPAARSRVRLRTGPRRLRHFGRHGRAGRPSPRRVAGPCRGSERTRMHGSTHALPRSRASNRPELPAGPHRSVSNGNSPGSQKIQFPS